MAIFYLRLTDAAQWSALAAQHLADVPHQPVVLGTLYRDTGATTTVGGLTVPVMVASTGFHVNLVVDELPAALLPFIVNPRQPKAVMFGNAVLSMPESLPEAGGTAMVERGVGQPAPDEVLARIERAVLRGRLTTEQAADRIARLQANLAVLDAREARAARRMERDSAVAALQAADAERQALIDQRAAQQAIRADAIAKLQTLTGAARAPEVERRDAATAEVQRLTPLIQAAADARPALEAARDAAVAALQAAVDAITAARAARDALVGG